MDKNLHISDFVQIKSSVGGSFSPRGDKIAFLSNLTGTSQLYIISRDGRGCRQLTFYDEPLSFAEFSPAENAVMFGMGKKGDENTHFYLYDVTGKTVLPLPCRAGCIYRWGGWSKDGKAITYSSNERNGTDFDVYVMNLSNKASSIVFKQGGWCDALGFSPSGKYITVMKKHSLSNQDLYLVEPARDEAELITPHEGKAEYGAVKWLPDEGGFYYVTNENRDYKGLKFYNLKEKKSKFVLNHDCDLESVTLTFDGKTIAVRKNEAGYSRTAIYDRETFSTVKNQEFPEGMTSLPVWTKDGKHLLFNHQSAVKNPDIWVWSKDGNKPRQLTHSPCHVPRSLFVEPELAHYRSFDGLEIPVFLYLPKNKKGRLPAIVNIHGGPESQFRPKFDSLIQYFIHRGYAVAAPNMRGSSGYGKKYLAMDDIEKRRDAFRDLESLYTYLESREEIDTKKLALTGTSYGGYMTLAGLAFFPGLWAAGVDIVGMSNLVTFLRNTSSWRRAQREAEYGYLESNKEFLESISPLNFIENIGAPLFIIHGKNDPRVPLSESEQIYQRLKKRGMKTEILVYDDEGHGLKKMKNQADAYPKIADFLDSCLK